MSSPFLSIIIPTRERADTLRYALQSCVTQDYADVEFIVCNNASTDDTEAVVQSFNDPRIRLINPGRRVSMRENWEFALGHASGRYITFIGDDDAVMPHAVATLAEFLAAEPVDAVKWQSPTYYWPQCGSSEAGRITLKFGNRIASVRSAAALNALRWGYLYYTFMPMIYHGALSRRLVDQIKARSGQFFCGESPDVYSGIVAAYMTEKYVYLQMPLTISGASRHSTGTAAASTATLRSGTAASTFFSEINLTAHKEFLEIADLPSSIQSCVTDALLRARDSACNGKLYVPLWYRLLLIVREVSRLPGESLQSPTHPLRIYSAGRNMGWLYDIYVRAFARTNKPGVAAVRSVLSIDTERFGVQEVAGAANFLGDLLGCVSSAPASVEATTRSLLFGRLLSKFARFDAFRLFGYETFS